MLKPKAFNKVTHYNKKASCRSTVQDHFYGNRAYIVKKAILFLAAMPLLVLHAQNKQLNLRTQITLGQQTTETD